MQTSTTQQGIKKPEKMYVESFIKLWWHNGVGENLKMFHVVVSNMLFTNSPF